MPVWWVGRLGQSPRPHRFRPTGFRAYARLVVDTANARKRAPSSASQAWQCSNFLQGSSRRPVFR